MSPEWSSHHTAGDRQNLPCEKTSAKPVIKGIRIDDHKFRSTAITQWLREGYTVPDVVQLAGHENMDTIQRYAEKLNLRKKEHRAKADAVAEKFINVGI